ncbi:long-chain fatty acid--CoA ligase [bacterium]|nr:long-chain fatty acid--CoA ligase [bacterium]MCI0606094.1 long-chain fatty acid--CoA ligase [bacterium]
MVKRDGAYAPISATEVRDSVESIAAALIELGVQPKENIGLLSENRPEWAFADLAILAAGAVTVPIYATLPAKQIEYIVNDSEMVCLFVSNTVQLSKILEIRGAIPKIRNIIIFDHTDGVADDLIPLKEMIRAGGVNLKKEPEVVQRRFAGIKPDDVFSIIYTSGTTGEPKGVMLTHRNVVSNIEALNHSGFQFVREDRSISFLPLSHILERMVGYYALLYFGCTIAYAESLEALPQNLQEVQPTVLTAVPRVFEKFYGRVMENVSREKGFKKKLAIWAFKIAAEYAETRLNDKAPSFILSSKYVMADELVLKKIRGRLGGRLRILGCGGAALPKQLAHFFYGIGLTILEGYGLTETSPIISFNRPGAFKFGTVGQPIPGVEVKIAEDGEILSRGPHIMKGYYKKPEDTAQAITPDGWFRTGDIGEIDADGYLKITDRKKDLIITSAGKNIAPQFVENTVKTSRYILQIIVVGDKRKFPSALVVPNMENLRKFAAEHQIAEQDIYDHPLVIEEVQRDIERLSQDLAPFEKIKRIVLLQKEFTIESGELTPSLKIKRNVVERKYRELIDSLYITPALSV